MDLQESMFKTLWSNCKTQQSKKGPLLGWGTGAIEKGTQHDTRGLRGI